MGELPRSSLSRSSNIFCFLSRMDMAKVFKVGEDSYSTRITDWLALFWTERERERMKRRGSKGDCSRKGKQKNVYSMLLLPEEIIVNILVRFSAEFLYECGKYVCKTWARMISDTDFVNRHLDASKPCLLLHCNVGVSKELHCYYSLELERGELRLKHLQCVSTAWMISTYDGVSLFYKRRRYAYVGNLCITGQRVKLNGRGSLYVVNLVTKQMLELPDIDIKDKGFGNYEIVRIPRTNEIKVCCYWDRHWYVLTVGAEMSWREISCARSLEDKTAFISSTIVASVEGVVYWFLGTHILTGSRDRIVAVDLCHETTHVISVPEGDYFHGVFRMGKNISCITGLNANNVQHIYVLDGLLSGSWTKAYTVVPDVEGLCPMAFLDDKTLIFCHFLCRTPGLPVEDSDVLVSYNVKTYEMKIVKVGFRFSFATWERKYYTKSLVSW